MTPLPQDHAIMDKMALLVARHMAAANLLGRAQIADHVRRKTGKLVSIASSSRFHPSRRSVRFDDSNDDVLPLGFRTDLPATNAVDYLRELTPVTKDTFDGLSAQYKADAFTIAGTTDLRLIAKVRDELADILAKGGTEQEFEQAVRQMMTAQGVADINAFALDTVFTTNIQKAYSLGRYEQMTDPAVLTALPYWQYLTVHDDRVRPEHAVIDGFTARATDPVWNKIYPPNGFNCRCIVVALLASEAPEDADESGMARLPLLARELVPTPGFIKVFAA